MTATEYQKAMLELGCCEEDVRTSLRLIGKFVRRYPWVNIDDLLTLGLESVPRALDTHDPERKASFRTHLMTVTRNACISFLSREEKQRNRAPSLGSLIKLELEDPQDTVSLKELMKVLAAILSPYAWQLIRLTQDSLPKRITMKETGKALGLSPVSVSHIYTEVRCVIKEVMTVPPFRKRRRKI